ncbi:MULTISPECIES: hypothetical protein [Pseudomonas]|uniref:hypothetical protein n=1 Tax=Pseudomonas TaxID=286 RepID=UPI00300375BC
MDDFYNPPKKQVAQSLEAKAAEQAQEIERLSSMVSKGLDNAYQQRQEIERLNAELEQLKSESFESLYNAAVDDLDVALAELEQVKKAGVVLPERSDERGSDGGLTYEAKARNACLDEVARLNPSRGVPHSWAKMDASIVVEHIRQTSVFDADMIGAMLDYAISSAPPPIPATQVLVERELPSIVTEALMGMIAAVTSTTPPPNEPPPPFIQAAIDRAVARIRAILSSKGGDV